MAELINNVPEMVKTDAQIKEERRQEFLDKVDFIAGYFRENPHRFATWFLNLNLKPFQEILICEMMRNNFFNYNASRSQGKTYLTSIYCVIRCILYPGTRICVASATLKQALAVLKKITEDLCIQHGYGSTLLKNEIEKIQMNGSDPSILFKNGSIIYAVAANKNARSKRANILICDEFVQMNKDIIDDVLVPFLNTPRQPGYLNKVEYADLQEDSKQFYLTSAWYKSSWGYILVKDYIGNMAKGKKYFSVSLPYQLSIKENLLKRSTVEGVMDKSDFNPVSFAMEYECIWFGTNGEEFFSFDDINKRRNLYKALPPIEEVLNNKNIEVQPPKYNEKRILSVDVALMISTKRKKNDATSLIINDCIPTNGNRYVANIVYARNIEGWTTDRVAVEIMRYYYKYKCTDIVIDTNGSGIGVFDTLIKPQVDPDTGEIYDALSCINDKDMELRCAIPEAEKVIWSIKANSKFNDIIATSLREGFKQGQINLLVSEYDCDEYLRDNIKGYKGKSELQQLEYKHQYMETTLLVNELINLQHKIEGRSVKIKERPGMRKDRYSSLAYNFWVMKQYELKLSNDYREEQDEILFRFRKPSYEQSYI